MAKKTTKKAKKVIKVLVIYDCDRGARWDTHEEVRIHELNEDEDEEEETPKEWLKREIEWVKTSYKKEKYGAFAVIGAYIISDRRILMEYEEDPYIRNKDD